MKNLDRIGSIMEQVWTFVRGDMSIPEFEQWAYSESQLEDLLGGNLYFEVISTDYRDGNAVFEVREALKQFAEEKSDLKCQCITLQDLSDIELTGDGVLKKVYSTFDKELLRGDPYWWLSAITCKECGQHWLVAQETRQNDIFLLKRIAPSVMVEIENNNKWPADFDKYEDLLRIGRERGHRWVFVDPLDSPHVSMAAELARQRPGIAISELAELLNVSISLARKIADKAIETEQVDIDRELSERG